MRRKTFPLATCFGAKPPAVLAVGGDTFYADGRVELSEEHRVKKEKEQQVRGREEEKKKGGR